MLYSNNSFALISNLLVSAVKANLDGEDMYRKKKQRLALLLIAMLPAYIILSTFCIGGSLLCFGQDGHVSLEFVQACHGTSANGSHVAFGKSDACGPCADVQFQRIDASLKNLPQTADAFSGMQVSYKYLGSFSHPIGDLLPCQLEPYTGNLAKIQSVVLLI